VVEIREAGERDLDVLCDLFMDFHEFHVRGVPSRLTSLKHSGSAEREALASRIREVVAAQDAALFVAELGSEILGFAEIYIREDEPSPGRLARRFAHLQSMFVRDDRRGGGIGSALLRACESWGKAVGAEEMRLDVWEFSEGPLGFYARRGYRTTRRSLTRELA
jgi:GNAT superfamily N-acetyltransferase